MCLPSRGPHRDSAISRLSRRGRPCACPRPPPTETPPSPKRSRRGRPCACPRAAPTETPPSPDFPVGAGLVPALARPPHRLRPPLNGPVEAGLVPALCIPQTGKRFEQPKHNFPPHFSAPNLGNTRRLLRPNTKMHPAHPHHRDRFANLRYNRPQLTGARTFSRTPAGRTKQFTQYVF